MGTRNIHSKRGDIQVGRSKMSLTKAAANLLHEISNWAIPFNKGTPPMDDFSVSVPGGIDMLGYLRIPL